MGGTVLTQVSFNYGWYSSSTFFAIQDDEEASHVMTVGGRRKHHHLRQHAKGIIRAPPLRRPPCSTVMLRMLHSPLSLRMIQPLLHNEVLYVACVLLADSPGRRSPSSC